MSYLYFLSIVLVQFIAALFCPVESFAQHSEVFFEKTYGAESNDVFRYAIPTSDGGYAAAGFYTAVPDTTTDVWIVKTDAAGDTSWTTSFGSPEFDAAYCVIELQDKNFAVCGVWGDSNDTDPNDFSGDVFVSLLDPSGELLWTWLYADGNQELHGGANSIIEDVDGNLVLTGGMRSYPFNKKHSFLLKLNRSSQTLMWNTILPIEDYVSYTTTVLNNPEDSTYTSTGLVYPPDYNGCGIYIVKFNFAGDTLWTNTLGQAGDYEARHMARTFDGGYIITGNTAIPPNTKRLAYLFKVDSAGNYEWHKHYPTEYPSIPCSAWGVVQTLDSGFAFTGYYPNELTNSQDLVLFKTDSEGNIQWIKSYGEEFYDKGYSINFTSKGFLLSGFKEKGPDNRDAFLIHTDFDGIIADVADNDEEFATVKIIPNPASEYVIVSAESDVRTLEVFDLFGEKVLGTELSFPWKQVSSEQRSSSQGRHENIFRLDVSGLPNGIYFLQVSFGTVLRTTKFIVSR